MKKASYKTHNKMLRIQREKLIASGAVVEDSDEDESDQPRPDSVNQLGAGLEELKVENEEMAGKIQPEAF